MNTPQNPDDKPQNAFQILGGIMSAAVGIRSSKARARDWSKAGTGTLLLALLIFVAVALGAMSLFVHLVRARVGA